MANYPMKTRKSSKFREMAEKRAQEEAEKKEMQDLKDTPPSMLDEAERFKLFSKTTRPLGPEDKTETFEERMRKAAPGQRKFMMAKGGMVSASKRADGCAVRGKTKGKML
jgi:hypothetical protein